MGLEPLQEIHRLRVLGVDPGPSHCGWGVVERAERNGRARFVAGGRIPSDNESLRRLVGDPGLSVDVVAIEQPSGFIFERARGAQVMATRGVADAIAMAAETLGRKVVQLTANQVRRSLCGPSNGIPGDRAVKMAVGLYVVGLPAKTNSHVRDALLVACWALFRGVGIVVGIDYAWGPDWSARVTMPKPWRPKRRRA